MGMLSSIAARQQSKGGTGQTFSVTQTEMCLFPPYPIGHHLPHSSTLHFASASDHKTQGNHLRMLQVAICLALRSPQASLVFVTLITGNHFGEVRMQKPPESTGLSDLFLFHTLQNLSIPFSPEHGALFSTF